MTGSSWAGVITSIATVITAAGGLVLAFSVLIPILRTSRRVEATSRATQHDIQQVHTIVNQQKTDAQRYQVALTQALKAAGIAVPIDQSLPIGPDVPDVPPATPTFPVTPLPKGLQQ